MAKALFCVSARCFWCWTRREEIQGKNSGQAALISLFLPATASLVVIADFHFLSPFTLFLLDLGKLFPRLLLAGKITFLTAGKRGGKRGGICLSLAQSVLSTPLHVYGRRRRQRAQREEMQGKKFQHVRRSSRQRKMQKILWKKVSSSLFYFSFETQALGKDFF